MLSGYVSAQIQEGRDVILAAGIPPGASAQPSSSWAAPPLSPPFVAPHVGKLLPQACHLEAKQCGVVEVEKFPQREQDGSAVSALLQTLNAWEQGFQPALGSHPTTEIPDCLPSQRALTKPRKSSLSWAASCRRRSAAWLRSSAPRHTRRPCISALRYCNTTVRSASASSSCRAVTSLNAGSHQHCPLPSFLLLAPPERQASGRAGSPGRTATSAHTHRPAGQNSVATDARAERRTGARESIAQTEIEK